MAQLQICGEERIGKSAYSREGNQGCRECARRSVGQEISAFDVEAGNQVVGCKCALYTAQCGLSNFFPLSHIRTTHFFQDGVNLCTFPEGTRSRSGRLMPFKNGAFKMAHKAGAPVIPISICGAANVMPSYWMFPFRPAGGGACTVVVHEPVESKGKTEEELATAVRESIIAGLPKEQRPLPVEITEVVVAEQPIESAASTKVELADEIANESMLVPTIPEDQLPLPSV